MSGQVDRDLLADYVGGALDGSPEARRVAGLIATSPDWRLAAEELSAALAAVDRDLGALRERAEVMPDDIAARFDELFASSRPDGPAAPPRDPLAQREITRRAGRRRRWRRWAAPVAVAAGAAAFFSLGGLPDFTPDASAPTGGDMLTYAEAPEAAAQVPTADTGRRYTRATLHGPGRATLDTPAAKSEGAPEVPGMRDNMIGELHRLYQPPALRDCLKAVAAVLPGKPTLVEYAYFEGRPALVISVTADTAGWKFVAGKDCGLSGADELYRTPLK